MARPRSLGSRSVTSRAPSVSCPAVTSSRPASMLSSVVLPQPEGPSSTRNSPSCTLRLRFSSTVTAPYCFTIWLNWMFGIELPFARPGGDALDEEAAQTEIDDEWWDGRQQRGGHVDVVDDLAARGDHRVGKDQRHRLCRETRKGETDQIVVPYAGDDQDQHHHHDVSRHRQDDLDEPQQEAARVNHRSAHPPPWNVLLEVADVQRQQG